MKRIFVLILAVCFMFGFMSFVAVAETQGRIEISFRVGDSILNINGDPVEVETPYVVDGVTLVPIRVITEAFGADVEWIGATRQVILTYRNVNIVLQIDNINAYVNEQRQTLLFQPQLTNDVTMVPLRFITENFGAEVGWDADTQAVTVIKESFNAPVANIEDILQRSNLPRIGDSFLGWSIRRTPDMELFFRQFDGRCNIFVLSDNAFIDIDHFNNEDNETFAAIRATEMEHARRYTLIGQNVRQTANGAEFVATQFRDRSDFFERRVFLRPNNQIVLITTVIDNSVSVAERDEYLAVTDTFDFVFRATEADDLSDVVNGMRLFDNRDLGIQFRVPAEWMELPNFDRMNYFMFGNIYYDIAMLGASIEIVSAQSGDSAERWAREELERSRRTYNPNTHTHSALRTMQIDGTTAAYFQRQGRFAGVEFTNRQMFWEYQGYLYSLNITVRRNNDAIIQRIVDSVRFEAINPDVVGAMIRATIADENVVFSSVRNTAMRFTMDVPATWLRFDNNSNFLDERNLISIVTSQSNDTVTLEYATETWSFVAESSDWTIIRQPTSIPTRELSSSSLNGFVIEFRVDAEAGMIYIIQYVINSENRSFLITVAMPEHVSGEANREIITSMIRSFVAN